MPRSFPPWREVQQPSAAGSRKRRLRRSFNSLQVTPAAQTRSGISELPSDHVPREAPESEFLEGVFLEKASETAANSAASQRAQRLRAAMGVHSPNFLSSRPENGAPARRGSCLVDGCHIAWELTASEKDAAQIVICLHDAGTGSQEFRPMVKRCPSGCRLLLVDWPSHGRSGDLPCDSAGTPALTIKFCAAIIESLIQQFDIEKPILLGSGFGAAAAIRFAADHADAVLGLVLSLPAGLVSASGAGPFSQRGKRGVGRLLRRMRKASAGRIGKETEGAARRQALRTEALRPAMLPIRTAAATSLTQAKTGLRRAVDSLSCPALFALSRNSQEYPVRKYLALLDPSLAWATQHQFTVFAGAFNPIWEEPDRFAVALASFIQARLPVEMHTHAWTLFEVDWPTKDNNLWRCVHSDCVAERVLPTGRDANAASQRK